MVNTAEKLQIGEQTTEVKKLGKLNTVDDLFGKLTSGIKDLQLKETKKSKKKKKDKKFEMGQED